MANAGRVAIVPKGDWSAAVEYKRLDAVAYNNTLYIAKKAVPAGTGTTNTEYWMKCVVGGGGAVATTEEAGIVKPDGDTITVDEDGTIHGAAVNVATTKEAGIVKAGDDINVDAAGEMGLKTDFTAQEELAELTGTEDRKTFFGKIAKAVSTLIAHINNKSNPHDVTKAQVGLGNCNNTADSAKSVKYATTAGTLDGFTDIKNSTPKQAGESTNGRGFYLGFNGGAGVVYCVPNGDMTVGNATNADTVDGKHFTDIQTDAQTRANARLARSGGTMTGNIDMNNNLITNIRILRAMSPNPLYLQSENSVQITNSAANANMDIRCATLHYTGLAADSYRGVKENISLATEERIRKILEIPVEVFDYRPGFGNDQKSVVGVIVDEVEKIIPEAVVIPEDWNKEEFNELLGDMGNKGVPGVDQTKFIPYLIALAQLQQKELDELRQKVTELKNE